MVPSYSKICFYSSYKLVSSKTRFCARARFGFVVYIVVLICCCSCYCLLSDRVSTVSDVYVIMDHPQEVKEEENKKSSSRSINTRIESYRNRNTRREKKRER